MKYLHNHIQISDELFDLSRENPMVGMLLDIIYDGLCKSYSPTWGGYDCWRDIALGILRGEK